MIVARRRDAKRNAQGRLRTDVRKRKEEVEMINELKTHTLGRFMLRVSRRGRGHAELFIDGYPLPCDMTAHAETESPNWSLDKALLTWLEPHADAARHVADHAAKHALEAKIERLRNELKIAQQALRDWDKPRHRFDELGRAAFVEARYQMDATITEVSGRPQVAREQYAA
jgi:hypothetical protein